MAGPAGDPTGWSADQWTRWYDEVLGADRGWQDRTSTHGYPRLDDDALERALGPINPDGPMGPTARDAFLELSDEFKQRIHGWHAHRHAQWGAWDDPVDPDDSIIDELEPPAIIGEAGSDGTPPLEDAVGDWTVDPDDLGVNVTLPNDNVAHVTGAPDTDPTVSIVDPAGNRVEPDASGLEEEWNHGLDGADSSDPAMPPPGLEPGDAELRGCLPSPRMLGGLLAAVILLGAGAYAIQAGGDDADDDAGVVEVDDDRDFAELDDGVEAIESDEELATEDVVEDCVYTDDHDMTLSTPEVVDGTMDNGRWLRSFLAAGDYPTPAFTISGTPPPGTTELAIVITDVTRDAAEVESDPQAAQYWRYIPVWVATGIDPAITEIGPGTALDPPLGATPQNESSAGAELSDGSFSRSAFISVDGSGTMLFTLLAMCNPPADYWDTARNGWLAGSIGYYSFTGYVPPLG